MDGETDEEQQEFRQGRGTTDGMLALRQLVEKKLEGQEDRAISLVVLDNAHGTIPREMTMATMRWMGVPEAEVRGWRGRMRTRKAGRRADRECQEGSRDVVGRQGDALSLLLFIGVMKLISRMICTKDILRTLLVAYNLAVVADGEANLQEQLIEWKDIFSRHGLRLSWEKS